MELYAIQVNHLTAPLGYRMEKVSFSWKVRGAQGTKQESARVQIAADEGMTQLLADTGYDCTADSLAWTVPLTLAPRTRYYYTVSVRSDAGEEAQSEVLWFETGKRDEAWAGKWITCDSEEKRHPIFEKEIAPRRSVCRARLYICGLGLYEASYNGQKIGNEHLTPYSNDYNQWVQYQTYDVTDALQEAGTLSVMLGNGWYKARFGFSAHEDIGFYGNSWKLLAELRLLYDDGSEEIFGTDESWRVSRSNITFSNLYDGEHRDDTLSPLPVERAALCDAPRGALTERLSTPVTAHEHFAPQELLHTPKGETVLDMGQEFTGIFRLRVNLPRGAEVRIQTGEILQNGCFYNENLRTAKSEYRYVSGGEPVTLEPHFTYYGYRYVKIEGIPELRKEDFEGIALYSEIPERGSMRTGHELVNKLLSNVRWGLKGNFLDVPTDCPQRDERMGWTGDAQVFCATATYLQDTAAFYRKYLYDMYQEQLAADGKVPDVIPSAGVNSTACVWGDAACIMPWTLYRYYGDKAILQAQFASMKAWVDYVHRVDGDNHGWRYVFHYGDWLALDNMAGNAEEVQGATDEEFIASVYYAASAGIVAKAARVLGREEDEREYAALSERLFAEVKREYFSVTGRCCIKTQTALVLALRYNLTDNRALVIDQLKKLIERAGNKLQTGFVGTPLLCHELSANGMDSIAWKLLLNEDYPGWLHEIKLGATTVWERWNSLLDDGTISGTSMNSMNHYAYGSIVEWLYRRAAGMVIPEDAPGCRRIDFRPSLNWTLREQEAVYDSPSGEYRSRWKLLSPTEVELSVSVPFGGSATLVLPHATTAAYESFSDVRDGVAYLTPGEYTVRYETDVSLKQGYSTNCTVQELLNNPQIAAAVPMLQSVPMQYRNVPLRTIAAKFGRGIEMLDKLDAMLARF